MGMEIQVDSLEDMCSLMCDNVIPKRRKGMTREDAIICLQGLLENPLINKGSFLAQAIEMAIKAFEQEPKTGHWIPSHIPESILDECSECGFSCGAFTFKYCPSCGARMVEPQESEE